MGADIFVHVMLSGVVQTVPGTNREQSGVELAYYVISRRL